MRRQRQLQSILLHAVMIPLALIFLLPIFWMIISATRPVLPGALHVFNLALASMTPLIYMCNSSLPASRSLSDRSKCLSTLDCCSRVLVSGSEYL